MQRNALMFQLFFFMSVHAVVVELSKHSKRRSDSDVKSEIKRPQHQRRNRLTIIDCQKCQLFSACEWGV